MRREFSPSSHFLAAAQILIVLFAVSAAADQPVTKVAAKPGGAVVSLSAASYEVSESGGAVEITVDLSSRSDGSMGFEYNTSDGTAVSVGDDPDFVAMSDSITFPARTTEHTIYIPINSDELVEGDEVFTVELIAVVGDGVTIGDPAVATVTILDDDLPASAGWSIEAGEVTLTASPTDFTSVTFQAGFAEPPVVVLLMGNDDGAPSHARLRNVTATGFEVAQVEPPGEDGVHGAETVHYLAVEPGRHELPAGSVIQAGTVSTSAIQHGGGVTGPEGWDPVTFDTALGDAPVVVASLQTMVNEGGSVPDEPSVPWLVAAIRNVASTGFDVALDRGQAADGQARNAETVGWVAIEASVLETLPAADAGTVVLESVGVSAAIDGGCSPIAFAGAYTETPLVIGHLTSRNDDDGGWLRRCSVTTTGADVFVDEDDADDTQHGNESAGFIVVSRPFNSDMAPELAVSFEAGIYGIDEENGSIAIDVALSFDPPEAVGVTVVTADGTATAGDGDYTALSLQLTWLPGDSLTQTIEVSIGDDFIDEGDEDFTLSLDPASLVGPVEVGATTSVTIMVLDDADQAGIVVTPTSGLTTTEDPASPDNTAAFTVALNSQPQPGTDVSIALASSDPTEGVPTPTSLVFDTLTWNAPQTVTVTGQDDAEDDDAVGYQIELQPASSADLGYHGLDPADVSLYNLDDEISSSLAYFDPPGHIVQETNGLVTITVRLQSPQPTLTEIDYATTDSSANWLDYDEESGRLQFLAGEDEKTFTVEIFEDEVAEYDEHVGLELRDAATGALLHTSTITIVDDDHDPAVLHRVVYSVGVEDGNLLSRPARAQITWSVASFDVPLDQRIGVGDILTTTTDRYIVTRRDNDYRLHVRSLIGHECDHRPTTDVVSITRAFNSLAEAVVGAADADHLGTIDLVAANIELELACYADGPDTQPVIVSGWTTGSDNTIRIFSPIDEYSVGVPQRSSGVAGDHGAGLEVVDGDCLTLNQGHLIVEGLELSCTGGDTTPLAGIMIGAEATGKIQLSDNLVLLQPSGTGDRIGITTSPGSSVTLELWNNVITGIGNGSIDRHIGMLIDGGGVNAVVSANTIFGGYHGIRVVDATVVAINNLVDSSTTACFAGAFDPLSHHNLSSDATAPGSNAVQSADVAYSQLVAGDHHLLCDPGLGWAEITTTQTNDQVEVMFDGDPFTPYHSDNISPAFVQFAFPTPQELEGIKIALGWGDHHRWMLAAADTIFDMENGSYTVVVPWRDTYPPDPQWGQVDFDTPLTTSVLRLVVEKLEGDYVVHICEIELLAAANQACNVGADLSLDENLSFTDDIDNLGRLTPWDIGADEGDPIEVFWSSDWVDASEEEGSVELELELTRPSSFPVTVRLESKDGDATVADGDYVPVSTTVTFPPGEIRASVPVTITADGLPENQEVFQVVLSEAGAARLGDTRWANIRINDEKQLPAVNINAAVSYSENTPWFGIPVSLEYGMPVPVTVEYVITGQTAIEGSDFSGTSGTLIFPPWSTSTGIDVRVLNDTWMEPDETFLVEITTVTNAELGDTVTSVVTIVNDDVTVLPTVSFATSSSTVDEGAGTASLMLQLSEPAGPGLSVNVTLTPQTATPVADYTDVSGSYSFGEGSNQLTIDIPIIADGDTETDETILLQLSNPSAGLQLGSPVQATLTILDDDGPPVVSFAAATAGVVEAAGAVDLTVVLDKVADVPVSVQVDTSDGSAAAGPDYQALSQILTIQTGQDHGYVTITVFEDQEPEDDETFNVNLTSPSGADLGAPSTAVVTILGDASLPHVSFANATYATDENQGPVVVNVVLDQSPVAEVSVRVMSADGEATGGADYTAVDQILTFAVGEISKDVVVELNDDAIYEHAETFSVSLSAPSGAILGTPDTSVVTIYQSDWPPFVYLAEGGSNTAAYSAFEQLQEIVIPVRLSNSTEVAAEIDYATSADTASAGGDYTEVSGTLVFAPGQTELFIVIPIADDTTPDNGETFHITLSNPVDCTLDGYLPFNGVVTIYDDEWVVMQYPEVSFREDAGSAVITVQRTIATLMEVRVDYSTDDGTATAGEDFTSASGTLVFPPGSLSQQIVVPLIDDSGIEGDETFTVTLSNAVNQPLGSPITTVVNVLDDEVPEVYFSLGSGGTVERPESFGEVILTAWLSFSVTEDVLVDYTTAEGTATEDADYTAAAETLTITAGSNYATFSVQILEDWLIEGDEVFNVVLGNPQGAVVRDRGVVGVIITDNDQAGVVVSPLTLETGEDGTSAAISLALTAVPSAPVTVIVESSDSTEGTVSPLSVEFLTSTWDLPQQVTVTGVDDGVVDGDIQYLAHVQPAISADPNFVGVDGDDVSVINIDDEEIDQVSVTIEQLAGPVDEDAGLVRVRAWLTEARPETIWVPYRTDGTADGDDFTITPADVIEFPAGMVEAEFEVTISNDLEPEPTESIRIVLESTRLVPIGNPHASDIVILDDEGMPVAAISSPLPGSYYRYASSEDPYTMFLDRSASSVPPGFTAWFAVLVEGSGVPGGPMDVAFLLPTDQEIGSFDVTDIDNDYIIRLVVADTVDDTAFRMADLPCSATPSCDSAEVDLRHEDYGVVNFEQPHAAPDVVFLRWGPGLTSTYRRPLIERSADGGDTWAFLDYDTSTALLDNDVKPGRVYHYRARIFVDSLPVWVYLGDTTVEPGAPVEVPVWGAPRIMPTLQSVEWEIPDGLTIFEASAIATLRLEGEEGESLAGSTIRVFVNEPTFDLLDGEGRTIEPEWVEWGLWDEGPAMGRDQPWCSIRHQSADLVVEVGGADSADVVVSGLHYGANGFRFEVEHPQRGISERSLLLGIHEFPENYTVTPGSHTRVYSRSFLPFFFSNEIREEVPEIWGRGPVYRPSPDCGGGDLTTNNYPNDSLYEADFEFWNKTSGSRDALFNVVTDTAGLWRVTGYTYSGMVDDTEYDLVIQGCNRDTAPSAWGYLGHIGRWILDADGGLLSTDSTAQFSCSLSGDSTSVFFSDLDPPLPADGHPPELDPADVQSVLVEDVGGGQIAGGFYTATSLLRFRITDLLHDVILDPGDPDTITIVNIDAGTSQAVYYSADQVLGDPNASWGWLVAEVPLRIEDAVGETDNQLVFYATDRAGNQLGGGAGIPVTVTRVREARYSADIFEVDETDDPTTEAMISVKLTAISESDITVLYSVTEDSASNAATAGVDFEPVIDQPLVIPAGVSEANFPVTIYGDYETEPIAETIRLTLAIDPSQPALVAVPSDAILHIVDDDQVSVSADVTAAVDQPAPGSVTIDGTGSVVPNLGLTGGGVAVWALTKTSIYDGHRSAMFEYDVPSPAQLLRVFLMPSGYDVRVRLVVAANRGVLDSFVQDSSDLHEIDPPCSAATSGNSCDTFDLAIENPCRLARLYSAANVDVTAPTDGYRLGLGDALSLACTASYSGLTPPYIGLDENDFGYRWSLASAADPTHPLKTFGLPGIQGFDRDNREFSVPWADIDLPMGAYKLTCEARYPPNCGTYAFVPGSETIDIQITHSLDGVAPGKVVEGGTFRVYSSTWTEGVDGYVFIDDVHGDDLDPIIYYGTVQPGGYLAITPSPGELPPIGGAPWLVSVAEDADGAMRSGDAELLIEPAGTTQAPNPVINDEETNCGAGGVSVNGECAQKIVPGQIWQGEWGEPGDSDYFTFMAGAGTQVRITLDRADTVLPPQHPDAPSPEVLLARPDSLVVAASDPLPLDATGTTLESTLTMDGRYFLVVRTPKGFGQYLMTLSTTVEGGSGSPAFGYNQSRVFLATSNQATARFEASAFDAFGNPISGAPVYWELGDSCGVGEFCGSGSVSTTSTAVDGFVEFTSVTEPGAPQLWQAAFSEPGSMLTKTIERPGVVRPSPSSDPPLGRLETDGLMVLDADLPDLATAQSIKETHRHALELRGLTKGGPMCNTADQNCPDTEEQVFQAVQLALEDNEQLIDLWMEVKENDTQIEELDGKTAATAVPLTLEVKGTARNSLTSGERDLTITEPVGIMVTPESGAAIEQDGVTCETLAVTPGSFTYWVGRDAVLRYSYTEIDGQPCCWLPTEQIDAAVTAVVEVDDGQGGTMFVYKRASTSVVSTPRPAAPCQIRPWPPGFEGTTPQISGIGTRHLPSGETSIWDWIGSVYATDACGNINHLTAADPQITAAGLSPPDPEGRVWAEVTHEEHSWKWNLLLRSTYCTNWPDDCDPDDAYLVPDGIYDISLSIDRDPVCGVGQAIYIQSIDYAAFRPVIQLTWAQTGDEPVPAMASPGSALRNPTTGEVIAWRVRPGEQTVPPSGILTRYTDIPVKLYVAEQLIYFDRDGNVVDSFRKVDDAEICVGQVHWLYDPDNETNLRTTTCDQLFTGETTVLAYTEPEWPSGYFEGYIGVAAGVAKVPDQAGSYYLVAEPLDEAFRRGDAWRVATDVFTTVGEYSSYGGTYAKAFEVGGGMFLDRTHEPLSEPEVLTAGSQFFLLLSEDSSETEIGARITVNDDGQVVSEETVALQRVGTSGDSGSTGTFIGSFNISLPDIPDGSTVDPADPTLSIGGGISHLSAELLSPSMKGGSNQKQAGMPIAHGIVAAPQTYWIDLGMVQRFGLRRDCQIAPPGQGCTYFVEESPCPVDAVCRPQDIPVGGNLIDPNDPEFYWDFIPFTPITNDNRAFHHHLFNDGGTDIHGTIFAERITDPLYPTPHGVPVLLTAEGLAIDPVTGHGFDVVVPAHLEVREREFIREISNPSLCTALPDCWHTAVNTFQGANSVIEVDREVNRLASRMALPPEIIKAHGFQESGAGPGIRFDPNVVRYEPLTADFRYFGGEFDALVPFSQAGFELYSLPGTRLRDTIKPPELTNPRDSRAVVAAMAGNNLVIPGCADCGFKLFFGNPGGVPPCNPGFPPGDCNDGVDPRVDPISAANDVAHEMEFLVTLNGQEVASFIQSQWFDVVGGVVQVHSPPANPTGFATVDPRNGRVEYHGPVTAGDTLEISSDPISSLMVLNVPAGTLVNPTNILTLLNQAQNGRPYDYPLNLGQSISDLNEDWYPNYVDPRAQLDDISSEEIWRLDVDGQTIDPKFDVTSQFVWAQAMGVFQFQVWQLIGTDYGINHMQLILSESGVPVFDLADQNRSLPGILEDFGVDLEIYRQYIRYNPRILYSQNPCRHDPIAHVNPRRECTHADWVDYISNDVLQPYNAADPNYANDVLDWVRGPVVGGVDFGGNVPY